MNRTNSMTLSTLFIAGLLGAAPAISAGNDTSMGQLPPEITQGGVTYMTGGIGKAEATAIRKEESKFPLTLEFLKHAKPKAEYLSDVSVKIKDNGGKMVLDTMAKGPFLLAKLPDGKYTVTAEDKGQTKERKIVIAANKPERIVFEW